MNDWNFIKVKQAKASEIAELIELSEEAEAIINEQLSPALYVEKLLEQQFYVDAVLFLAFALPKREGVWWACLCAKGGLKDRATAEDLKAIELAEAWVYKPTAENCQRTMKAAESTNFHTAAGWAAIAAFWSGESISTVGGISTPPAEDLSCKAVNAAEALAASKQEPEKINEYHQHFLKEGIDIACGGDGSLTALNKAQVN